MRARKPPSVAPTDVVGAMTDLETSNAFVDPGVADVEGLSLRLPARD
jgi:hypothetical protein